MAFEIEAKIKVDDFEQIRDALEKSGAKLKHNCHHRDYYFDDTDRRMQKQDKCLRIRRLTVGDDEKVFLTYKGPKEPSALKSRKEFEVEVSCEITMLDILASLNFDDVLIIDKQREIWLLDDCEIGLDTIGNLGKFVEIEGPTEKAVDNVIEKLGFDKSAHIQQSYASMIQSKIDSSNETDTNQ